MGVTGLWSILESVGHPIKIDGLEGKRLGVDANIWLYKFIRGFKEKENGTSLESHKLGLFNRISKLLYYRIKPVFVFDGPAPVLKRKTLEKRQNIRNKQLEKVQDAAMKLLAEQLKAKYPGANVDEIMIHLPVLQSNNLVAADKFTSDDMDLFYLPADAKRSSDDSDTETIGINSDDDDDDEVKIISPPKKVKFEHPESSHDIDIHSEEFNSLPAEVRYEILVDIREARKRIRRTPNLPEDANSFSSLQMERLRMRRLIQEKIEQCERDICASYTGGFGGSLVTSYRVQSDASSTMLYCKNSPGIGSQGTSSSSQEQSNSSKVSVPFTADDDLSSQRSIESSNDRKDMMSQHEIELESKKRSDKSGHSKSADLNSKSVERKQIQSCEDQSRKVIEEAEKLLRPFGISYLDAAREFEALSERLMREHEEEEADESEVEEVARVAACIDDSTGKGNEACGPISAAGSAEPTQQREETEILCVERSSSGADRSEYRTAGANTVTPKIIAEAKELLRLFGVPYVEATGEAEAQCAVLEKLKLTEGTITDDSDVWLFGAQNVFRYFFSDDKYVMQYKMTDIEYHIRMTRENLVCFAMLVGSDYTEGLNQVGPVTALEILSEFPGPNMEPLIKFGQWKRELKSKPANNKRRQGFAKLRLPDTFPSRQVFDGYMRPWADASTHNFTWATPELDELREYARRNFGWPSQKVDDKLLPVMKRLSERRTQPTIDSFFFKTAANVNPELFRSKRVNSALDKMASSSQQEVCLTDEEEDEKEGSGERQPANASKGKQTNPVKKTRQPRNEGTRNKESGKEKEEDIEKKKNGKTLRKKNEYVDCL